MNQSYQETAVELNRDGFSELQAQLINNKGQKSGEQDIRERPAETEDRREPTSKKYFFRKGDQSLEVDDDYEIEFMADKRPTRLTLRE